MDPSNDASPEFNLPDMQFPPGLILSQLGPSPFSASGLERIEHPALSDQSPDSSRDRGANGILVEGKKKGKDRKSKCQKKVEEARIYKCNKCNKSYLSYPALYTHTKLKHMNKGESTSITNGKMRGRPKKSVVIFCLI